MKSTNLILICMTLILCISTASANTATFQGDHIKIYDSKGVFSSYLVYSGLKDIAVKDNVLYVATPYLVKVISIADAKRPTGITNMKPAQNCLEIKGNYMYMGGDKGITVLDISVPNKPKVVKNIGTSKPVTGIEISNNILAVVTSTERRMYDISKPAGPRFIVPGC